jgi:hypothetical protein
MQYRVQSVQLADLSTNMHMDVLVVLLSNIDKRLPCGMHV